MEEVQKNECIYNKFSKDYKISILGSTLSLRKPYEKSLVWMPPRQRGDKKNFSHLRQTLLEETKECFVGF